MLSSLVPFFILMAIAWIWLDGARAREFATTLVRRYCDNRGLQFLDETVSLSRIGLRWTNDGVRVRRMFRFEFSLEGVGRRTGYILMLGMRLESVDDGLPQTAAQDQPEDDRDDGDDDGAPPAGDSNGKVVPFRRRH